MGIEIERKFLVVDDSWKSSAGEGRFTRQGYLCSGEGKTVRVRTIGEHAFLTVKGPTNGISRSEFEYEIPSADAERLFALCGNLIEKTRYIVPHAGLDWEVDVFSGMNTGLVLAEVELESEHQPIELPAWSGAEVSGDSRYYNARLSNHPFILWS